MMMRTTLRRVRRSVAFDALLFRPCNVMRPEKAPNRDGELHAGTGIRRNQSLPNCNIQNPPKNPKLLMNGRGFQGRPSRYPSAVLMSARWRIRFLRYNSTSSGPMSRSLRVANAAFRCLTARRFATCVFCVR